MALRTPIELMPRTRIRRDAREVAHILGLVGLDPKVGLGLELSTMLAERIQECRDLFALRGVRTKRPALHIVAATQAVPDLMVSALRQMRDGAHSPATTAQASNVQWMTPRASSERRAA